MYCPFATDKEVLFHSHLDPEEYDWIELVQPHVKHIFWCIQNLPYYFSLRVDSRQLGRIINLKTKNNIQKWEGLYFIMVCLRSYGTGSSYCSCSIQLSKFLLSLLSWTPRLLRNLKVSCISFVYISGFVCYMKYCMST